VKAIVLAIVVACFAAGAGDAFAQQAQAQPRNVPTVEQTGPDHHDIVQSPLDANGKPQSKSLALLFWAFAGVTIGGALFVVTRRNLVVAVMGMVGCFIGIAATYMMLYANFLAVIQMLVYAGAIMVLFVFVIMILNRPEEEPVAPTGRVGKALGAVGILYLIARLVMILISVTPPDAGVAAVAPMPTPDGHAWGGVAAVGANLFGPGLFPFEAISVLLLIAVVGAIAVARPLHEDANKTE
jgi:NADH-quinone oxidoreductase subunit J